MATGYGVIPSMRSNTDHASLVTNVDLVERRSFSFGIHEDAGPNCRTSCYNSGLLYEATPCNGLLEE